MKKEITKAISLFVLFGLCFGSHFSIIILGIIDCVNDIEGLNGTGLLIWGVIGALLSMIFLLPAVRIIQFIKSLKSKGNY